MLLNKKYFLINSIVITLTIQIILEILWLLLILNYFFLYEIILLSVIFNIFSFIFILKYYQIFDRLYIYKITKYLFLAYVGHKSLSSLYTIAFLVLLFGFNEFAWPFLLFYLMGFGVMGFIISNYKILYYEKKIDLKKFYLFSFLPIFEYVIFTIVLYRYKKENLFILIILEIVISIITLYLF